MSGYQVRFERDKRVISRFFNDRHYTDTKRAAEIWRDLQKQQLPSLPPRQGHLHTREVRKRAWKMQTRTNVPGVGYTSSTLKDGSLTIFIAGYWDEGDKWATMKRSVRKHGLASALLEVCRRVALETIPFKEIEKRPAKARELFEKAYPFFRSLLEEELPEALQYNEKGIQDMLNDL